MKFATHLQRENKSSPIVRTKIGGVATRIKIVGSVYCLIQPSTELTTNFHLRWSRSSDVNQSNHLPSAPSNLHLTLHNLFFIHLYKQAQLAYRSIALIWVEEIMQVTVIQIFLQILKSGKSADANAKS